MSIRLQTAALAAGTLLLIGSGAASAQTDPGVRASLQSAPGAVDHRHERQGEAHSFHQCLPRAGKDHHGCPDAMALQALFDERTTDGGGDRDPLRARVAAS